MEGAQNDPMRDVEAANIIEMSSPIGDIRNEAQARELAPPVKEAWDQLVSKIVNKGKKRKGRGSS